MSPVMRGEASRRCVKCGRSTTVDSQTYLYRFPKPGQTNILRCELWARYCFPDKEYWSAEFQRKLHAKHVMLCDRHFPQTSFSEYPNNTKRLHRGAVPINSNVENEHSPIDLPVIAEQPELESIEHREDIALANYLILSRARSYEERF